MKVKIFLPILLILAIILLPNCATQKPVSIENIYLCETTEENNAPKKLPNIFPTDIKDIYLSINVENITPDDKINIVWTYLDTGDVINKQTSNIDRKGSGFIGFNLHIAEGFPSGSYKAEVFLNEEKVEELEFSVQ